MGQETLRFRIRPDGRVEETVEGVLGLACERVTERIEARLGTVQQRQPTTAAFADATAASTSVAGHQNATSTVHVTPP